MRQLGDHISRRQLTAALKGFHVIYILHTAARKDNYYRGAGDEPATELMVARLKSQAVLYCQSRGDEPATEMLVARLKSQAV